MTINYFGGGAGGGSKYLVPHSEVISGGATWHWPLADDAGVESIVGGSPVDNTGTLVFSPGGKLESGTLDSTRSSGCETGAIGAPIRIAGAITIAGWFRRNASNGTNLALCGARISGSGPTNNIQWELGLEATTNKCRWLHQHGASDATDGVTATVAMVADTWEHWTATRNAAGTIAKLYLNGSLDVTSATMIPADGGTAVNQIALCSNLVGAEFPGNAYSIIVYEEELDATDVAALYNSTCSTGAW